MEGARGDWNLTQKLKDTVLSLFYNGLMGSPHGQLGASSLGDESLAPRTGERTALCFQDIVLKVVDSDTWSLLTGIERDVPVVYSSGCVHRSLDFTPGGLLNSLVYCSSTVSVLGRG